MTESVADTEPWEASGRPWWLRRLHVRCLAIVALAFLVIIVPGTWLLLGVMHRADNEELTARIGNLTARTAIAIERHFAYDDLALIRDLMSPLAADRAFLCAELRDGQTILSAVPAVQGCVAGQPGNYLEIPVDEQGRRSLRVGFTDAELQDARNLELTLGVSAVVMAFLAALFAGGLAYRFLIWRPLTLLTDAIAFSAKTGERRTVDWSSSDEIGLVVGAYNTLVTRETSRELKLRDSYHRISASESALGRLNQELEDRVRERTVELEAAKREADRANDSKTQFLWSMSHELRTPLNAIIGFSEMISREMFGPVQPPRYREFADDILFSGQHLLRVINDLLDIARIEVGRETLDEEPVRAAGLLSEVLRVVQPLAREQNLSLHERIAPRDLTLQIDATKTKQILLNLLSNAIKHTQGGGSVSIDIAREADGRAILRVSDTGVGIPPEDLAMVLEPFGRAENQSHLFPKGTGLGLPLARRMAELHGGELDLQSEVGVGTTVTVHLPASRVLSDGGQIQKQIACSAT